MTRVLLTSIALIGGPAALLASAQAAPTQTAPAAPNAATLYHEERGQGPALVLLHDGLLHSEVWDAQWEPFSKSHRVVRYDQRGYGRSPAATERWSELDDLRGLIESLGLGRVSLVGASAGGNLVMQYALKYPETVDRLVLVGPIVSGFGFSDHFIKRGEVAMRPLMESGDVPGTIENWLKDPFLMAPASRAAHERARDLWAKNPQNIAHMKGVQPRGDGPVLPRLSEIKAPTLIVVGEADIPDVHAHCGVIQNGIAGSKRVVVPGAGHLVYLEKPEEFNKIVLDFLGAS